MLFGVTNQNTYLLTYKMESVNTIMGISTQALKPDSLDSDPRCRLSVVLRELHKAHTTGIALMAWISGTVLEHCHTAQHTAPIRIEAMWRQSGLWNRIPNPHWIRIQVPMWRAQLYI